jgi:hypothetical protein
VLHLQRERRGALPRLLLEPFRLRVRHLCQSPRRVLLSLASRPFLPGPTRRHGLRHRRRSLRLIHRAHRRRALRCDAPCLLQLLAQFALTRVVERGRAHHRRLLQTPLGVAQRRSCPHLLARRFRAPPPRVPRLAPIALALLELRPARGGSGALRAHLLQRGVRRGDRLSVGRCRRCGVVRQSLFLGTHLGRCSHLDRLFDGCRSGKHRHVGGQQC